MLTVDPSIFDGLTDNQIGVLATSLITGSPIENVIFVEGQQVGDAVDTLTKGCWLLDGRQVGQIRNESKHDKKSKKYGNLFNEYEQTFSNWRPTTKYPEGKTKSGLPLAVEQADIFTFIAYGHRGVQAYIFTFNPKKLYSELLKTQFPSALTEPGCNGNKPGSFARGWRLPFRKISQFYPMMVDKYGSFDNFYELTKVTLKKLP